MIRSWAATGNYDRMFLGRDKDKGNMLTILIS